MKRPIAILLTLIGLAIVTTLGIQFRYLFGRSDHAESAAKTDESPKTDTVELSAEKFAAAEIVVAAAGTRELRSRRIVPGRIDYNATRHVQVKSPFGGLIRRIDVKVGDRVTEGQVLAIVESPDLGELRSDVKLRKTDLQRATEEHDWWHSIESNLNELIGRLKRPQNIPELSKEFADRPLGDFRQQVLSAYSQLRLDETLNANIKNAKEGVAGRMALERESARDTAIAKFDAVCEQAVRDVKKTHLAAEATMNDAERRLAVARQRLSLLVGQPVETLPDVEDDASLSTWPVKAPFTATVEEVLLAPKERIQSAEGLFQLADTSRLWVQADVRERDWSALSIHTGQIVNVQSPALPGKQLDATVAFVGRTVAVETHAVPLTADIDNKEGLLRPGMFVRVLIPDEAPRKCLAIPQSAVTSNDGRTFVFVQTAQRTFKAQDVKTGLSVDPWIEIQSGLGSGDQIVTEGVAILKAELLLEPEE